MKTVLYLIQTSAGLPKIYECLKKRSYILLSYKEDTSDTTIYAPDTTWAGGRNRLYQYVKDNNLLYDYYVFMDEDVILKKTKSILIPSLSDFEYNAIQSAYYGAVFPNSLRSKWPLRVLFDHYFYQAEEQDAGFENFEESLKLDYPLATMNYYNLRYIGHGQNTDLKQKSRDLNWPLQTAALLDSMFIALHQEVFFANTILPYTEKYEADTWSISGFIFYRKAHHYYPKQIMQNNQYTMLNIHHSNYPTLEFSQYIKIQTQAYTEVCAELGVDKVQISKSKEIKAHLPLKQVEDRFMSRLGFFIKFTLFAIFYKLFIKLNFIPKKRKVD